MTTGVAEKRRKGKAIVRNRLVWIMSPLIFVVGVVNSGNYDPCLRIKLLLSRGQICTHVRRGEDCRGELLYIVMRESEDHGDDR